MGGSSDVSLSCGAVFLDAASIDRGDIDMSSLQRIAEPLVCISNTRPDELHNIMSDAWCVMTNKVRLNRAFFESRPNLRLVCVVATGVNNVDVQAAKDHDVTVMNCSGYSTQTVAQHTMMLILMLLRSFPQYQTDIAANNWSKSPFFCMLDHPIRETKGLKLGIVGFGTIGQCVARLAEAFGMEVIVAERPGANPRTGRKSFEDVLKICDILSVHCPLAPETQHLVDSRALSLMQQDAFLINTARGGLIDETALLDALSQGQIAGAALDVLSIEPPSPDNPLIHSVTPNLIITPHNAWGSREARQRAIDQTTENVRKWLSNKSVS